MVGLERVGVRMRVGVSVGIRAVGDEVCVRARVALEVGMLTRVAGLVDGEVGVDASVGVDVNVNGGITVATGVCGGV